MNTPAVGPPLDQVVEDLQQAVSTYLAVGIYDADFDNPGVSRAVCVCVLLNH